MNTKQQLKALAGARRGALVPGASAGEAVTAGFGGTPAFQPFHPSRPEWRPPGTTPPADTAAPSP